jgi:LAO/AO transport system kinase
VSEQKLKPDELAKEVLGGNRRLLARALTHIENESDGSAELLNALYPKTGNAYVVGFTGSPGAGKSTLVDRVAMNLVRRGKKVAVLAVDPSSPFTGGAILGDRVRMSQASDESSIFIRSMASRGALGGLGPKTAEMIFALDAVGFDFILLETVGVGQGEVEVVRTCDTVVLVLVPGMGDSVQALKAGILEIADVFVINKADYDGADRLEKELLSMLGLRQNAVFDPPIVRTVAVENRGIDETVEAMEKHRAYASESGERETRRESFLRQAFNIELDSALRDAFDKTVDEKLMLKLEKDLLERKGDPRSLARSLVATLKLK